MLETRVETPYQALQSLFFSVEKTGVRGKICQVKEKVQP